LEEAAELSQSAALNLEMIGKRQAAKLLIPTAVTTGEQVQLRYRGYTTGLIPLIDILDFDNNPIVQAVPMAEISGKPGLYEYVINEIDSDIYVPETSFTVIVTESSTGSVESGAVFIETAAGQLLMPETVLMGDKLVIRYRGREDWKPRINVYDFEDNPIVAGAKMTKSEEQNDVFEYTIQTVLAKDFPPGKPARVVVEEAVTAAVSTGTFIVESSTLTTLEGLVAASSGTKGLVVETLEAIQAVEGTLATGGDINMALSGLRERLDRIPRLIEEGNAKSPIVDAVNEISRQFTNFAGDEGMDFGTLLEKGLEESATVTEIRTKTDEVQGATEVMQKVIEQKLGGEDAPVVHGFFH
jgi:hypothetical protein